MTTQNEQAARISSMEEKLNVATRVLKEFEEALTTFEQTQADMAELSNYYGSELWFADVDAHEEGELPSDLRCGVLSEDLAYNVLVEYRNLAIRMLEAATRALKEG